MMADTTIPREALEALAMAIYEITGEGIDMDEARAVCRAVLEAWPGVIENGHWLLFPHTKLPLPKENNNDR